MRMMKTLLVVCFVLMVSAMMVDAKSYYTGINWDTTFTLPYPAIANDYHVKGKVWSANGVLPTKVELCCKDYQANGTTWRLTGESMSESNTEEDAYDFTLDFKTNGTGFVFFGAKCHFGIKFKTEDYNRIEITEAYWTYNGQNVGPSNVVDFHAWDGFRGAQVELGNHADVAVDIHDLQVAVTAESYPLAAMARDEMGTPATTVNPKYPNLKWVNYSEKIHIEAKSTAKIDLSKIGVNVNEGEFLHLRFTDLKTDDGTWIQHQHKIGFGK